MRSRSAAFEASRSSCSARNSLRSMVSWLSVAGVSSTRRAATISASDSSVPLLPTASLGSNAATSATTGASTSRCGRAGARRSRLEIGSERDELGGEAGDAERDARRPHQAAGVADHHLEAAAAEVEAQRGDGIEHHRRAHRAEDRGAPPRARRSRRRARRSRRGCGRRPRRRSTARRMAAVALARISVAPAASARSGSGARWRRPGRPRSGGSRRDGSRRHRGAASPSPARADRCGRRRARRRRAGGRSSIPGPWPRRASPTTLREEERCSGHRRRHMRRKRANGPVIAKHVALVLDVREQRLAVGREVDAGELAAAQRVAGQQVRRAVEHGHAGAGCRCRPRRPPARPTG